MSSLWKVPEKSLKYRSVDEGGNEMWEVDRIIGKKIQKGKAFYKVLWEGFPETDYTWEPLENLENVLPLVEEYEATYGAKLSKNEVKKPKKQFDSGAGVSTSASEMELSSDIYSRVSGDDESDDKFPSKLKIKKKQKSRILDDLKEEQFAKLGQKKNEKTHQKKYYDPSNSLNPLASMAVDTELDLEFKIAKKDSGGPALVRKTSTPTSSGGTPNFERFQAKSKEESAPSFLKSFDHEKPKKQTPPQAKNGVSSPKSPEQHPQQFTPFFQQQHQLQPAKASLPKQLFKPKPPVDLSNLGKNEPLKLKAKECYEARDKMYAFCTVSYDPRKNGDESCFFLRDKKSEVVIVDTRQCHFKLTEVVHYTAESLGSLVFDPFNEKIVPEGPEQEITQPCELSSLPFVQTLGKVEPYKVNEFGRLPLIEKSAAEPHKESNRQNPAMNIPRGGKETAELHRKEFQQPPLRPPDNKPTTGTSNKSSLLSSMLGMIKVHAKPSSSENSASHKPQPHIIEEDEPELVRTPSNLSKERSKPNYEENENTQPERKRSTDSTAMAHKPHMEIERPSPPHIDHSKKSPVMKDMSKESKSHRPPPLLGMPPSMNKPTKPSTAEKNLSLENNFPMAATRKPAIIPEIPLEGVNKGSKESEMLTNKSNEMLTNKNTEMLAHKNGETEKEKVAGNTNNLNEIKQNILQKPLLELKALSVESASELIASELSDKDLLNCLSVKGRVGRDKPLKIVALDMGPEGKRDKEKTIFKVYWLPGEDLIQRAPSLVPYRVLLRHHPDLLAECLFDQ